jgi:hypothetical protein
MEEVDRALRALYSLLEESDRLALSRGVRLRIVAVIGELEAAVNRMAQAPRSPDSTSTTPPAE